MVKPTITVCIPTYNGEEFLVACLESVLAQTYLDYEVLIVDDRSSDSTVQIAEAYALKDRRVQIVQNPQNLGLVGNWNRCAELAKGEWIKYVFQDDLIAPTCLEQMLAAATPKSDIICCRREFIFDASTPSTIKRFYENILSLHHFFPAGAELSVKDFCQVILSSVGHNFVGEPTAVMLRRSVFSRFGPFNPHLIQICDLEFWARIAVQTGIVYVDQPLATFRLHGQSTSSKNHADRQYRVEVLDPLMFLHDLVRHPLYAPLRAIAASQHASLEALLRQRAYQAHKDAQRDPGLQQAWNHVLGAYPALLELAEASVLQSLTYELNREWGNLKRRIKLLKSQVQRSFPASQF
jgi:glycosyltransferase involved in cell wall biosynthesis